MSPPQNVWRVAWPTLESGPSDAKGLLEPGTDVLPVRITIVQDDVTTGWDDGALGFEDEAVWFSGRTTSFRLEASDILPGKHLLSRREAVTDGEALRQGFPLRHPGRDVWIRVGILKTEDRKEWEEWEDEAWLVREVKRLRALSNGGGESQYPPLAPRPGMIEPERSPYQTVARYALGFAALALGAVLSGHVHWFVTIPLDVLGMALVCFGGASSPHDQKALRSIAAAESAASSEAS